MIFALLFLDAVLGLSVASKCNFSSHAIEINHPVMELEMTLCPAEGNWYSGACRVSLPTLLNFCGLGS